MSDGRMSASASLQSSVGATSAEELAEKYQKLFLEFSRIKAQHSVLKKAVRKEQAANVSLQDECKTKEQELRSSLQQLDLLNFHNERLTKRIQSLQDSGNARLSPGWLLGSAKKELERSKVTLEATTIELTRKIEENEKLHKELFEVNSLYTQHVNVLQTKISDLEKKTEELQVELTRSHLASEEALSTMRQEKREVEVELDQIRAELRITKALMEKNEQKLKEGDDALRAELIALRKAFSINLGLADETQSEQFNALSEKFDSESNEIIASFKQLQFSTREYLNALKDNSDSSYELSVKVKNASQAWQKNLQNLAVKLTSTQNQISELASEKEFLVKENESYSIKVLKMETEISRLKEELDKQKITSNSLAAETAETNQSKSKSLNNGQDNTKLFSEQGSTNLDNNSKLHSNGFSELASSQNDSLQKENLSTKDETNGKENGAPILTFGQDDSEDDDNGDDKFIYPVESSENKVQSAVTNGLCAKSDNNDNDNVTARFPALERDMSVRKEDDAKQRENLIKNHYECKIVQLKEQLQLTDSKVVRFYNALKNMQTKLADAENGKSQADQEIIRLQSELAQVKETLADEKRNHKTSVDTMTEWIQNQSEQNKELEQKITELTAKSGPSTSTRSN